MNDAPPPAGDRPNVLLILTDDQQFDAIGALGNDQVHTPELDRLVRDGVAFTRAAIMGGDRPAVCCPSRAMLHTGRSLYRTRCARFGHITADTPTLAETFRAAGYRTFATGKQHNGPGAIARGFTDVGKVLFGGMGHHMGLTLHDHDPDGVYAPERGTVVPRFSSEVFTDAALEFLDRDRTGAPFFMYLAYTVPHDPLMAPPAFMSKYDPARIRLDPTFQPRHAVDHSPDGEQVRPMQSCDACTADAVVKFHDWPIDADEMRRMIAAYYAMISHLDAEVGRVRARLEATGAWENTVVVFASDNGIAMGRHGGYHKQTSYDHDAHVPLILAGPGLPRGETRDALVYLHDLYPTLCELVGLDTPDTVESLSFAPVARGERTTGRDVLYHAYTQNWRAVHDGRYRFLAYADRDPDTGRMDRRRLLFDLSNDPREAHDLADDPAHADTCTRLEALLIAQRDLYEDPILPGGFWQRWDGTVD